MQTRWRNPFSGRGGAGVTAGRTAPEHFVRGDDRRWPQGLHGDLSDLVLTVDGLDGLTRAFVLGAGRAWVTRITLVVTGWVPLTASWSPAGAWLPDVDGVEIAHDATRSRVTFGYRFKEPRDLGTVLLAALRTVQPHRPDPGPATCGVAVRCPTAPGVEPFLARVSELVLPGEEANEQVRRTDTLLLTGDGGGTEGIEALEVLRLDGEVVRGAGRSHQFLLDPCVHNPIGRNGREPGARARLEVLAGTARLVGEDGRAGERCWEVPLAGGIDRAAAIALRTLGCCDASGAGDALDVVRLLVQLSAIGVVVHSPHGAPAPVDPVLAASWAQPLPPADDLFACTAAAVAQRRIAMRCHGSDSLLRTMAGSPDQPVSVLLLTMRPDRLAHAIEQVAASTYPNLQLVLGLHGDAADLAEVTRRASNRLAGREVVVVPVPAAESFGAALGRLSERADGTLLTKFDDDDHYGPEHVRDLVLARDFSGASVVGKPPEYVYLEPLDLTVRRPGFVSEGYGTFAAGGTLMISRADLDGVGGWRPVPRSVDRGLLDRVLALGGQVYATHGLGYLYVRHGGGHTWTPDIAHFLRRTEQQWSGVLQHPEFGTVDDGGGGRRDEIHGPGQPARGAGA